MLEVIENLTHLSRLEPQEGTLPLMFIERRGNARTNLHIPVFLFPNRSEVPIRTETRDITISGFFCNSSYAFSPGEHVRFLLLLPQPGQHPATDPGMYLRGDAEVIRVSVDEVQHCYGAGFRIANYAVLRNSGSLSVDQALATVFQTDCD